MHPVVPDQVFCLRGPGGKPTWKAIVGREIIEAEWADENEARAAMLTEQRRRIAARKTEKQP